MSRETYIKTNSLAALTAGQPHAPPALRDAATAGGRRSPLPSDDVPTPSRGVRFAARVDVVYIPPRPAVMLSLMSSTPDLLTPTGVAPTAAAAATHWGDENVRQVIPVGDRPGAQHNAGNGLAENRMHPNVAHAGPRISPPLALRLTPGNQGQQSFHVGPTPASLAPPQRPPEPLSTGRWGAPPPLIDDIDDDEITATPVLPQSARLPGGAAAAAPPSAVPPRQAPMTGVSMGGVEGDDIDESLLHAEAVRLQRLHDEAKARRAIHASAAALAQLDDMTPDVEKIDGWQMLPPLSSPDDSPATPAAGAPSSVQPQGQLPAEAPGAGNVPSSTAPTRPAAAVVATTWAPSMPMAQPAVVSTTGQPPSQHRDDADVPLSPFSAVAGGSARPTPSAPLSSVNAMTQAVAAADGMPGIASPVFDAHQPQMSLPPSVDTSTCDDVVVAVAPPVARTNGTASQPTSRAALGTPIGLASSEDGDGSDIDLLAPGGAEKWLGRQRAGSSSGLWTEQPAGPTSARRPQPQSLTAAINSRAAATVTDQATASDSDADRPSGADDEELLLPVSSRALRAITTSRVPLVGADGGPAFESPLVHSVASAAKFDSRVKYSSTPAADDDDDEDTADNEPTQSTVDNDDDEEQSLGAAISTTAPPALADSAEERGRSVPSSTLANPQEIPFSAPSSIQLAQPGVRDIEALEPAADHQSSNADATVEAASSSSRTTVPVQLSLWDAAMQSAPDPTPTPQAAPSSARGTASTPSLSNWVEAAANADAQLTATPAELPHTSSTAANDPPAPSMSATAGSLTSDQQGSRPSVSNNGDVERRRWCSLSQQAPLEFSIAGLHIDGEEDDDDDNAARSSTSRIKHLLQGQPRCALCGEGPSSVTGSDADTMDEEDAARSAVALLPLRVVRPLLDGVTPEPSELAEAVAMAIVELQGGLVDCHTVIARSKNALGTVWPVVVHAECALWSPEVYTTQSAEANSSAGDDDCGPRVDLHHVGRAIDRGSCIKCAKCRRVGATLGCVVETCQRSFHLPCALALCNSAGLGEPKRTEDGTAHDAPLRVLMNTESFTVRCDHPRNCRAASAEQRPAPAAASASEPDVDRKEEKQFQPPSSGAASGRRPKRSRSTKAPKKKRTPQPAPE